MLRREGDVHAPAQVAEHRAAVALEARDDLDLARVMERPARRARPEHARQVVHAARREREAVGRRREPVALATAAISMPLFVPSRNELNICALKSPWRPSRR
jgi:hypothetical protein